MKFFSYVTSKTFGGMAMPVPAQNSCMREFVRAREGSFVLPVLESHFVNCFHQLFGLLRTIENSQAIVMYSVTMLPNDQKLEMFLEKCAAKDLKLAFVLESFVDTAPYKKLKAELDNYSIAGLVQDLDVFLEMDFEA